MQTPSSLEMLESRIAPAVVVTGLTATYTDLDGDVVTVKVSKGPLNAGLFIMDSSGAIVTGGQHLLALNLTHNDFEGASVSLAAKPGPSGGDGFAAIFLLDASGNDLGKVTIDGDLSRIAAGNDDGIGFAVKTLAVQTMGTFLAEGVPQPSLLAGNVGAFVSKGNVRNAVLDATTNGGTAKIGKVTIGGSMIDSIFHSESDIGTFTVRGDMQQIAAGVAVFAPGKLGLLQVAGHVEGGMIGAGEIGTVKIGGDLRPDHTGADGSIGTFPGPIGSVSIGGSLIGGSATSSGRVLGASKLGSVTIAGDVRGGSGDLSGIVLSGIIDPNTFAIIATGTTTRISVGGSVHGGAGDYSGLLVSTGDLGSVKIGRDLIGGAASNTGDVTSFGNIGSVTVGGSVFGGSVAYSGRIVSAGGHIIKAKIGRDLVGGSMLETGTIFATSDIGSITIGGSVLTGDGFNSASIRSGGKLGSVSIVHDVTGSLARPALIIGMGDSMAANAANAVGIKSVKIGGSMTHGFIGAGYDAALTLQNLDAAIGSVSIKGDMVASHIGAGITRGLDNILGTGDDQIFGGGNASLFTKIGSVTIGGMATGTHVTVNATDAYYIAAQTIGSVKIAGVIVPIPSGGLIRNFGPTSDFAIVKMV